MVSRGITEQFRRETGLRRRSVQSYVEIGLLPPRRLWFFYCRKSHFSSLGSAWYVAAMKKAGWPSALVTVILLAVAVIAEAQQPAKQPTKIPWIGYLAATGSGPSLAFIQGLSDLGYVEGENIAIVFRTAGGKSE